MLRTLKLLRRLSVPGALLMVLMLGFWALGLAVPLEEGFAAFVSASAMFLLDFNLALNLLILALCFGVLASSYAFPWGAAIQACLQALLVWGASAGCRLVERLISRPIVL